MNIFLAAILTLGLVLYALRTRAALKKLGEGFKKVRAERAAELGSAVSELRKRMEKAEEEIKLLHEEAMEPGAGFEAMFQRGLTSIMAYGIEDARSGRDELI